MPCVYFTFGRTTLADRQRLSAVVQLRSCTTETHRHRYLFLAMATFDDAKVQHRSAMNVPSDSPNLSGDELSREKATHPSHLEDSAGTATTTTQGGVTYTEGIDPEKERKLIRKIDLYVIPWVGHPSNLAGYAIADWSLFLRIGNAAIPLLLFGPVSQAATASSCISSRTPSDS